MSDVLGQLWAGALAGYAIAVPVGAVATYLVGLTARTSWRVGAAAGLGVVTADGLYALAATLGGAALAATIAPAAPWLRLASGVVLVALAAWTAWVAVRDFRASSAEASPVGTPAGTAAEPVPGEPTAPAAARRPARTRVRTPGPARAYAQLLALTAVNPATVVYFAAVVVGARATSGEPGGAAGAAAFVTGAFLASASWQLLLASGGAVLGRRLSGPRGRLATGLVSAAVMLVLVVALLG